MKKFILVLAVSCIYVVQLAAQTTETRSIETFNQIKACCGVDVYISQGSSSKLTVTAPKEVVEQVKTTVTNGVLDISVNRNKLKRKNVTIMVEVTAENLTKITGESGADIYSRTDLTAKDITLKVSSGSDMKLTLYTTKLTATAESGGDIELRGTADYAKLHASGGSDLKLKELIVDRADAMASGGSDIIVKVTGELNATASGGSDIEYYGNPRVTASKSGGSDITAKQ